MTRAGWVLVVTLLVALACARADADPLDEFGFGSENAGTAGASRATGVGVSAAHDNPAGIARTEHPTLLLGYGFGDFRLQINGRTSEVLNARGSSIGLAIPLELNDDIRVGVGLAMYLPDQFLARIQLLPASEPRFIRLDNAPHRIVIDPTVSIAIGDYVSIGVGTSLLADALADGITFNVGVVSGEKVGESELDATLPMHVAPLAGLLVTPTPRVRFGASARGELSLDVVLDILANVDVAGVVTGDALVTARATSYFTPLQIMAGAAVDVLPDLTLMASFNWLQWSAFPSGAADVRALVDLDVTPPLVQSPRPPANFTDIVNGRVGVEYRVPGKRTDVALRAGYAFLPTPVPDQVGITSFADNDRHQLSLGGTITLSHWKPVLTRPISIGLALQWQKLVDRLTVKDARDFPGTAFASSGNILHISSSVEVSF